MCLQHLFTTVLVVSDENRRYFPVINFNDRYNFSSARIELIFGEVSILRVVVYCDSIKKDFQIINDIFGKIY